jgi:anion-transporting  ArsA/GET3 family ATPase
MELAQFCASSRIVIVAGKGGVGKTTVVATLATMAARTGASVLVVEVEGKSGLSACLGLGPLTYDEVHARPRLRVRALSADDALLEYLHDRGLHRISGRLVRSGTLEVVSTAVPGMRDILLLGKVKQLEQSAVADLIVLDAPAAGHAITFLLSPRGLQDAVRVGPVRHQADEVVAMLSDPARCQVLLVTLPEETPVNEVVDTAYALEERVGIALGPIVVNQCLPHRWCGIAGAVSDAALAGIALSPEDAAALDRAATFVGARRALQQEQIDRLARRLPLPQVHLPFVDEEIGPDAIEHLADVFAAQVAGLATVVADASPSTPPSRAER